MTADAIARNLHVKSLNYLARSHHLTYVGARVLAESLHASHIAEWTQSYIVRKIPTGRRQVYWKHSLFKGFDADGKHEFRKCVVGSPTTQLTEIWLLDRLAREREFELPPCVYSYELSRSGNSHAYRYFYSRYRQRELDVADAASRMNDARVIVFDLRRFYPSVDVKVVRDRFENRIAGTTLGKEERDTAVQCVEELTGTRLETGLPIGPPLSHALANVFLSSFDSILSAAYPGRYFRYVDDVAIVAAADEIESVKEFFEEQASQEGFQVHHGKFDVLSAAAWKHQIDRRKSSGANEFGLLLSDLRRYLAHNPDDYEALKRSFRSEGFSLPFARLRSVALGSSPFRRWLDSFYALTRGENIPRPAALLQRARDVRRHVASMVDQSLEDVDSASNGMRRRWHLQHLRNAVNRSLYLFPEDQKASLLKQIPDSHELRPTNAVLEALVTGNASALTMYAGPTVSAFCELWLETKEHRPELALPAEPAKEERDSVGVMALYGLCSPPNEWTAKLAEPSSQTMVDLSSRKRPIRRIYDDFSYIDEMQSLFLKPGIEFDRILSTRFDDEEDVVLPALDVGEDNYLS